MTVCYYIYVFYFIKDLILKKILFINGIHIFSYIFFVEWINEAFEDYAFISLKTAFIKFLNFISIFIFIKNENDFYKYIFLISFLFFK